MKLYELYAHWEETFDIADIGSFITRDFYETVAFEVDGTEKLEAIKDDLESGFRGKPYTVEREWQLEAIYPGYDKGKYQTYRIVEVTNLIRS